MNEPSKPMLPAEHERVPDGHQMAGMSPYLLFAHEPYYPLPAREIKRMFADRIAHTEH
ncbi:hypothetical protein ACWET9_48905 [Streptomyces sp. NPDC004059]